MPLAIAEMTREQKAYVLFLGVCQLLNEDKVAGIGTAHELSEDGQYLFWELIQSGEPELTQEEVSMFMAETQTVYIETPATQRFIAETQHALAEEEL